MSDDDDGSGWGLAMLSNKEDDQGKGTIPFEVVSAISHGHGMDTKTGDLVPGIVLYIKESGPQEMKKIFYILHPDALNDMMEALLTFMKDDLAEKIKRTMHEYQSDQ